MRCRGNSTSSLWTTAWSSRSYPRCLLHMVRSELWTSPSWAATSLFQRGGIGGPTPRIRTTRSPFCCCSRTFRTASTGWASRAACRRCPAEISPGSPWAQRCQPARRVRASAGLATHPSSAALWVRRSAGSTGPGLCPETRTRVCSLVAASARRAIWSRPPSLGSPATRSCSAQPSRALPRPCPLSAGPPSASTASPRVAC
mmetsp:Transcript_71837/g.181553  ORF Transcript_71837/g.181553 Transcript_71837/m.181553 type:complete len:201 (+) Transcript_71837:77-679(+)